MFLCLLDHGDFLIRGELLPADDQQDAERRQTDRTQERRILDSVDLHAEQERERRVVAERADPCPRHHAEESEHVASDRIERDAGRGFFFRQVQVEDVRVGKVQTDAAEMLDAGGQCPEPFHAGRQHEHEEFRQG